MPKTDKERVMRTAEAVLSIIRNRGERGLPLEDVYRQLFNPNLYLLAYGKIAANAGATTSGVDGATADGMSLAVIDKIIDHLRTERYQWDAAKRVYIEKRGTKKMRPLGMPTWTDKLLQEVIRLILEAYYEPQFSPASHGFRPQRGCNTALSDIYHSWTGTKWFIEGDIAGCFDNIDHEILLNILARNIYDQRFLRLIGNALKAGYMEKGVWHHTESGTPQGGIASPILANIYLDQLDTFVKQTLLPEYTRGTIKKSNPAYNHALQQARQSRQKGLTEDAKAWQQRARHLPTRMDDDPTYRRLRYIRYADDFLLGFNGPHVDAEDIKRQISGFLADTLHLKLSDEKTLITHAHTGHARFLGYNIHTLRADHKQTNGRRAINGTIGLRVPQMVIRDKARLYMKQGRPCALPARINDDIYSIVMQYQAEYRGLVNYYQRAYNLRELDQLKWVMQSSLLKTMAAKLKIQTNVVVKRYGQTLVTPHGTYRVIQVIVPREGQGPLVATWGAIPLKWSAKANVEQKVMTVWNERTELLTRLLATTCENCGATGTVEVHHVRRLGNLKQSGRKPLDKWDLTMIARNRKTLVLCKSCHDSISADQRQGVRQEKRTVTDRRAG